MRLSYIATAPMNTQPQETVNSSADTARWYDRRWLTVVLVFLFPPVGLYALWKSRTIGKGWKVFLVVWLMLIILGRANSTKSARSVDGVSPPQTRDSVPAATARVNKLPADQLRFIEIVQNAKRGSRSAANDMARGGLLATRNQGLRDLELRVNDWVGKLTLVDSNSDGWGVLAVEIADDVRLSTWNNSLSDIGSGTLIKPGTALFQAASALKEGQTVRFSGTFVFDPETGLAEQSISLRGKLEDPEFTFRFSSVAPF